MNEELQFILDSAKESMQGAVSHLENELLKYSRRKSESCYAKKCNGGLLWRPYSL